MSRTTRTPSAAPGPAQLSLLPPDAAAVLHLVRENLRLLADLAARHEAPALDPPAPERGDRALTTPERVAAYLGPELAALAQEQVRALLLDTRGRLLQSVLVCQGGLNLAALRPADCLREAVRANAAGLILAHNHPSGDPTPSPADLEMTKQVVSALAQVNVTVHDHIIVGKNRHTSFKSQRLI
jgi:DNA repair protein RadC